MEQDVYKWLLFPHLGSHFLFVIPVAHVRSFHDDAPQLSACGQKQSFASSVKNGSEEVQFSRFPGASLVSWWFPER